MNSPILVTGGTGFVGSSIVIALVQSGYSVRLVTRPDSIHSRPSTPLVEIVPLDLADEATLTRACQGVQAVIHLVGIIHESARGTFTQAHVETTRAVLRAAAAAGVKRYLHMSALGTRKEARSRYHQTKWEAEELVRRSGLDWTLLRPSLIFGPGDGIVTLFARLLSFPCNLLNGFTFPRLGGGQSLFSPIAVEEVASAFVQSLKLPSTIHQTYTLCGRTPLTLTAILSEIIRASGQKVIVEEFPLLTILRHLLWGMVVVIPLLLTFLPASNLAATLVLLWLASLGGVIRWRTMILYPLPWIFGWPVAWIGQYIKLFGQPLLTPDQLLMLQEGNTGDPEPAATTFNLALTPFAQGISAYVGPTRPS